MSIYAKVEKKKVQKIKEELVERGLLDPGKKFRKEGEFVLIPVKQRIKEYEIIEKEFNDEETKPNTLKEALKNELSEKELELVPVRFDVIGNVAILDLDESLIPKVKKIAGALLKIHKHVRTVCIEEGTTKGEFRIKPVSVVLGESTLTEHRESGITMILDVKDVYFSPRLSAERLRIADLVDNGERVLVMFAGVGPYALVIAKKQAGAKIVAIEINPAAFKFMERNILKNRMYEQIEAHEGDVREIVPKLGKFDRIIMPLPKDAGNFLDVAKAAVKPGGIIHFYQFSSKDDPFTEAEQVIREHFPKAKILNCRICGEIAPRKVRVVIDFKVS